MNVETTEKKVGRDQGSAWGARQGAIPATTVVTRGKARGTRSASCQGIEGRGGYLRGRGGKVFMVCAAKFSV